MNQLIEKYKAAIALAQKYRDAPRSGWVEKGSRSRTNQAIQVPRAEVEKLAEDLASARYSTTVRLYEIQSLKDFLRQIAKEDPASVECKKCYSSYSPKWAAGECPCCKAEKDAVSMVDEMLKDGDPS